MFLGLRPPKEKGGRVSWFAAAKRKGRPQGPPFPVNVWFDLEFVTKAETNLPD